MSDGLHADISTDDVAGRWPDGIRLQVQESESESEPAGPSRSQRGRVAEQPAVIDSRQDSKRGGQDRPQSEGQADSQDGPAENRRGSDQDSGTGKEGMPVKVEPVVEVGWGPGAGRTEPVVDDACRGDNHGSSRGRIHGRSRGGSLGGSLGGNAGGSPGESAGGSHRRDQVNNHGGSQSLEHADSPGGCRGNSHGSSHESQCSSQGGRNGGSHGSSHSSSLGGTGSPRDRDSGHGSLGSDWGEFCRICHESGEKVPLVTACRCSGSMKHVHNECLIRWILSSFNTHCEICLHRYRIGTTGMRLPHRWKLPATDGVERYHMLLCAVALAVLAGVVSFLIYVSTDDGREAATYRNSPLAPALYAVYAVLGLVCLGLTTAELHYTVCPLVERFRLTNMNLLVVPFDPAEGSLDSLDRLSAEYITV